MDFATHGRSSLAMTLSVPILLCKTLVCGPDAWKREEVVSCQSALTGAKLRWSGVSWEHRITSGWATWALWFSRGFFSGRKPLVLPSRSSLFRFRFLAIVNSDRLYFFSWLAGMALLIGWSDPACQSALTGAKLRWSGVLWDHRITSGWSTWAFWFSRGFFSGRKPLVLLSRSSLSRFRFLAIVGSDRLYFFSWLAGMALLIGWSDPAFATLYVPRQVTSMTLYGPLHGNCAIFPLSSHVGSCSISIPRRPLEKWCDPFAVFRNPASGVPVKAGCFSLLQYERHCSFLLCFEPPCGQQSVLVLSCLDCHGTCPSPHRLPCQGIWHPCSPWTLLPFLAIALLFARTWESGESIQSTFASLCCRHTAHREELGPTPYVLLVASLADCSESCGYSSQLSRLTVGGRPMWVAVSHQLRHEVLQIRN